MVVVLNLFFDEFSPDSCFVCELIVVGAGAGGRGNAVLKFTENNFLVCPLASIFEWGGTTLKLGGLFSSAHDLIVPFYESCVSGFTGPHVIEAVTDINLFFLILNSGRRYRHLVFSSEFGSFVSRNKQLSFKVHNDIFGVANTDPWCMDKVDLGLLFCNRNESCFLSFGHPVHASVHGIFEGDLIILHSRYEVRLSQLNWLFGLDNILCVRLHKTVLSVNTPLIGVHALVFCVRSHVSVVLNGSEIK